MVNGNLDLLQRIQYFFCFSHFIGSAMDDYEILVGFYRSFIFNNAVFGDAYTKKTCAKSTETSHSNGSFQASNDNGHNRASHNNRAYPWDHKKGRAKQDTP